MNDDQVKGTAKGMMRIPAIAILLLLTACATPDQYVDQTAAYIAQNYGPLCTKLGYKPDTEGHRNCMVSMYNTDQTRFNNTPWGRSRR